jgi:regulator of telomere elongation helicase 1
VRSLILTSGTLSPMNSFAKELGVPFEVRLENAHVIGPQQAWVGVIPRSVSGVPLNSSYRTRQSAQYKIELGQTLVNLARLCPAHSGMLVFFPSYALLVDCLESWKQERKNPTAQSLWERICACKAPVVEPRESSQVQAAMEDFREKVRRGGAIFLAVCRGKVAEGLDFADEYGRAVVVIGLPFPSTSEAKVAAKRRFLDEAAAQLSRSGRLAPGETPLNGNEWYVGQAARAVNQALGRVIRHRNDWAAMILLDERFAQRQNQEQLSRWIRPYLHSYTTFDQAAFQLNQFYKLHAPLPAPSAPAPPAPATNAPGPASTASSAVKSAVPAAAASGTKRTAEETEKGDDGSEAKRPRSACEVDVAKYLAEVKRRLPMEDYREFQRYCARAQRILLPLPAKWRQRLSRPSDLLPVSGGLR